MKAGSYDVLVVGGGLVGSAIAYGLVGKGLRVALLDEGDRAYRAARGNFGLIWVQSKGMTFRPYAALSRRSSRLWSAFSEELREASGIDVRLRWGGLQLVHSEDELARLAELMRHQFDADLPVPDAYRMLDRRALLDMLPAVGPQVTGAAYCALDGTINPLRLLRALLVAFQRKGGRFLPGARATRIDAAPESFTVTAGEERVHGAKLVLAAGLGNAALAPLVGIDMPISPLRGQILITEKRPPWLEVATHIVRQMDEGGTLIGDSQEDVGYDDRTLIGVMGNIAERAVKSFPCLAEHNVVRAWGCLRIMTADGIPIYEQSREHPGAFAFAVHSGVTLAALHAQALAHAVLEGRLGEALAPFSGDRFALSQPRQQAA